jgi:hypothetical protein
MGRELRMHKGNVTAGRKEERKSHEKGRERRERHNYEDQDVGGRIILIQILDKIGQYGLDLSGTGYGPVAGSYENGNDISGYIECRQSLE